MGEIFIYILQYINECCNIIPAQLQPIFRYKIHDRLYDLTDFAKIHPGRIDMFNNLKTDTNITPMVYAYHKNPKNILAMLPKYEVPSTDLIKIHEKKIPLHWSNTEIAYNATMLSVNLGIWSYCFWNANDLSVLWMVLLAFLGVGFIALVFHETSHYIGFKKSTNKYIYINVHRISIFICW